MTDEAAWVGNPENFSQSHVESLLSKGLVGSAVNLEKAIFSLEYVAQLKNAGLDFIFKGGSAVQILLGDRWNRLSIDVDVCTDASKGELIEALGAIGKRFGGRGFSYEAREGEILGEVPFHSFRVTTPPITYRGRVILLDAMGLKPSFATRTVPLRSFYYDSAISVVTPTIGAFLGDKLSTIGPKTVGRAMRDSRNGLEYAKHFYDINALSHAEPDPEECSNAYSESLRIQLKVRCRDFTVEECIDDSAFTCQVASLPQTPRTGLFEKLEPTKMERAKAEFKILKKGLSEFRPFLVKGVTYSWDNLREYASRTALLTKAVNAGLSSEALIGIFNQPPPSGREEIEKLWSDIQSLQIPKEQLWFIDPEEILNFPTVLKTWHSFYTVGIV